MVQWVEELALLQLRGRLQLQYGFNLWPGNFHMLWVPPKEKLKKKKKPAIVRIGNKYHRIVNKGERAFILPRKNSMEFEISPAEIGATSLPERGNSMQSQGW